MAEVVNLAARAADKPTAIEMVPVPLNRLEAIMVFANHHAQGDQRICRSIEEALQYAAALSARHGCPVVPVGAAAEHCANIL